MYKYFFYLIIAVFSFSLLSCNRDLTYLELDLSNDWEFFYPNDSSWYNTSIPSNIHLDLLANKLIDNPFQNSNADSLIWISSQTWKYRKQFNVPENYLNNNIELVFDGIDNHADIYLNGIKLAATNNMFRQWVFVLKDSILKAQNNILEVNFLPSSAYNTSCEDSGMYAIPNNSVFTRKSPYQYGWDWAPSLETAGIYKKVYLRLWKKLHITDLTSETDLITDTIANITAYIEIESENYYNADLSIISINNVFDTISQKIEIFEGKKVYEVKFAIRNPKLWWCNNVGEAYLYPIRFQINTKFRKIEKDIKIGLRNIELVTDIDAIGQSFYFKLNSQPVFARGANWVPAEYFSSANNYNNYLELLLLAKEANFNMIRVWGGGLYENDDFYNICDSLGIMVWQDFMFACAFYPLNDNIEKNIVSEVEYQVKRLQKHPSLVLWCGNNEISNAWFDWGYQKQYKLSKDDSLKIWKDYDNLFHKIIPTAIKRIDKTRAYIPSSPFFGWGRKQSITHGDSHYWGVWWGYENFEKYYEKTGRFMSEYGFQSFPEIESIDKFINDSAKYLYSNELKTHQKHVFGFDAIDKYMHNNYLVPKDFNEYVYMSQVQQAEGMQIAFDAHLSVMPYCMGTLFWQFNDCWPVISWSAVDYYKKPKAIYYYAKRMFPNIMISNYVKNDELKTFVVNHINNRFPVKVNIYYNNFKGNNIINDSTIVMIDALSSNEIIFNNIDYEQIKKYADSCYIKLVLKDFYNDEVLYERLSLLKHSKDLNLLKAEINCNIKKIENNKWKIELNSDVFVKNLYINIKNVKGKLSDNYFHLEPNTKKILYFTAATSVESLKLKILSENDIYIKYMDTNNK